MTARTRRGARISRAEVRRVLQPDYSRPIQLRVWQSWLLAIVCGWGLVGFAIAVALWLVRAV